MRAATPLLLLTFVAGCAFKGTWLRAWQWSRSDWMLEGLRTWDPGPILFGEFCLQLFFDTRGIAPGAAQIHWFEVFLIIGSGLQWTLAAAAALVILRKIRSAS